MDLLPVPLIDGDAGEEIVGDGPEGQEQPGELRLMGAFELRIAGRAVPLPPRAQKVLAYLALSGRTGRSRLAGELWPDVAENQARRNLRTAVWRINQTGGRWVTALNESLDLSPLVQVDTRRLVATAGEFLAYGSPRDVDISAIVREAVNLLPDWDDAWLYDDREHLRQLAMHMGEEAATRLMRTGQYGLAMAAALAVVRAEPLRESAQRIVIAIHLAEGNVAEATRRFAHVTELLDDALGTAPSFRLDDLDVMGAPTHPRDGSARRTS